MIKGSEVEVVGTDGTVLNTAPRGGYGSTAPVEGGVGQAGVYFYDESTGDLSVLGKSGPAQVLGDVTPAGGWNTVDNISLGYTILRTADEASQLSGTYKVSPMTV